MQKENRLNAMQSDINYVVHVNAVVVCPWGAGVDGVPPPWVIQCGDQGETLKRWHGHTHMCDKHCKPPLCPVPVEIPLELSCMLHCHDGRRE